MGESPKSRFPAQRSASERLDSWKRIAAYLDRDPRTVQLWEKQEGLPVYRLGHHTRSSVYAYKEEIDEWLEARSRKETSGDAGTTPPPTPIPPTPISIPRKRRIYGLAALGLTALLPALVWIASHRKVRALPSGSILAVLPFENRTSNNDLLADELTDGLISDLGRIGKIQVICEPSMLAFKARNLPLPQVAAQLHASLVLQGFVSQSDNQIQVTVNLVNPAKEAPLWSAAYTNSGGSLLAFQNAVASKVAIGVTRRVTGSAPSMVFPLGAADPRAMRAYLTGLSYLQRYDAPGLKKAISCFGQAIAIDPRYVPAYAGMAESYDLIASLGVFSSADSFQRAKATARIALTLDPSSASAYNALAFATCRRDWDFPRAEHYFRKAIELNPDNALAHQWYGNFLADMLRFDQSLAEFRKADELDPLSPMAGSDLADGYLDAGRLAEAGAELKRVLDLYPDFVPADLFRIRLYLRKGDLAAAEVEARVYFQRTGNETPWRTIEVQRLVAAGNLQQARDAVRSLLAGANAPVFDSYRAARLFFATGQKEAGYRALEQAYRERSWRMVALLVDPGFASVRNEPRFRALARRVGLPVAGDLPPVKMQSRAS